MRRAGTTLLLALLIGYFAYRGALATMPGRQPDASTPSSFTGCTNVLPPRFDAWSGLPIPASCTFGDGRGVSSLYAGADMYEHFGRSLWIGLAVVPLAFVGLWWFGRRRTRGVGGRIAATLALAMGVAGCGSIALPGDRVQLLTGVDSCWAGGETGMPGRLLVDADHGTSFNGRPVMWPVGFTGARADGEVEVLDAAGKVVATTGREYYISHGRVANSENLQLMERINAFPAAANCGYPWDFVDCTAHPADPYCRTE